MFIVSSVFYICLGFILISTVVFGGAARYSSDDINKFLWMVRIAQGVYPDEVNEQSFYNRGSYRMDASGSPTMLNSLMYKISYYRFGEISTEYSKPLGYDIVRQVEIGVRQVVY